MPAIIAHSTLPATSCPACGMQGSDAAAAGEAIRRAVDAYMSSWEWWSGTLVKRCMAQDWSWTRSADQYLDLYRSVTHVGM